MGSQLLVYSIGFLAQLFFSARILVQWIMSERAKQVLSPSLFWILSLAGAYLLCIYGWLRNDFAIVLGQFISYYTYIWNLYLKGIWQKTPLLLKIILIVTPLFAIALVVNDIDRFADNFLNNADIPLWLVVYGSLGQVVFTLRFVYQWFYTTRVHQSVLPAGFWIISLIGSATIVSYAVIRLDPVLIVGQSFGIVAYTRNLFIGKKEKKEHYNK